MHYLDNDRFRGSEEGGGCSEYWREKFLEGEVFVKLMIDIMELINFYH